MKLLIKLSMDVSLKIPFWMIISFILASFSNAFCFYCLGDVIGISKIYFKPNLINFLAFSLSHTYTTHPHPHTHTHHTTHITLHTSHHTTPHTTHITSHHTLHTHTHTTPHHTTPHHTTPHHTTPHHTTHIWCSDSVVVCTLRGNWFESHSGTFWKKRTSPFVTID